MVEILGPAWDAARPTRTTQAALAQALEVTHRGCTNGSSPTRPPRAGPFALARAEDPAANLNAQSIVIHPLHRPGAPGIDQPVTTARLASHESHRSRPPRQTRPPHRSTGMTSRRLDRAHQAPELADLAARARAAAAPERPSRCSPSPWLRSGQSRSRPRRCPTVKFVDITKEAGINFVHNNGALGDKLLPETMGSGVAFLDYDGDGDQDLFFVNSSYWPGHEVKPAPTQALYRNDGKGHFEDVTKEAGLDKTFYGQGVAVGDYDNDGDPDLYVTAIGRGYLFRNDGKGHFDDVTDRGQRQGTKRLADRRRLSRHRQ